MQAQQHIATPAGDNMAQKRLMRDLKKMQTDPPEGISAAPEGSDIMKWSATMAGPEGTPFEGGLFQLNMSFSSDYPHKPPDVQFLTKMFHPNVYNDGRICLDILRDKWSPVYDVASLFVSIRSLLAEPNPNSPANPEAAAMYKDEREKYVLKVQQMVEDALEEMDMGDDDSEDVDEE